MEIDIITYTPAQFAALTEEQLLEVKSAQLKKNRLAANLEEDLLKEKHRLVKNGVFLSEIWPLAQEKLQTAYEQEVAAVRDALLFYLQYSAKPDDTTTESAPYTVDYSLDYLERFSIVKTYYETAYEDGKERFDTFKADKVAAQYLGEMYAPLYDYLLDFVPDE